MTRHNLHYSFCFDFSASCTLKKLLITSIKELYLMVISSHFFDFSNSFRYKPSSSDTHRLYSVLNLSLDLHSLSLEGPEALLASGIFVPSARWYSPPKSNL